MPKPSPDVGRTSGSDAVACSAVSKGAPAALPFEPTVAAAARTPWLHALLLMAFCACSSTSDDSGTEPSPVSGGSGGGPASGGAWSGGAGNTSNLSGAGGAMSTSGGSSSGGSSAGSTSQSGGAAGSVSGAAGAGGSTPPAGSGGISGGSGGGSAGNAGSGGSSTGGASNGGSGNLGGGGAAAGSAGAGGSSTPGPIGAVTPCETNLLSKCSGTPLACHFGGNPGNYEVTVQLGASGQTEVEAEAYRRMLTRTTAADAMPWLSFVTNVRVYEGEPVRPDQSGTSKGISGLDVYFRGTSPKPLAICYRPIAAPVMVWLVGDSTVADQQVLPFAGWGQHLPAHFVSPVSVANYADSGESSGSVLANQKLFPHVRTNLKRGDFVLLQVGHNDDSDTSYRANVLRIVQETKAAGANMILVTPISRARGTLAQQHGNMPQVVRDIGRTESVPVLDMTVATWNWIQTINWPDYFANGTDGTHTNHKGAQVIAGLVAAAVKTQVPELAKYVR
ncbi:MAG TPA: SGNH/GDSL hydrolase family protein [Polyangiaceae bacterium]|nr:SGNH/GDSL hydrolase family protein [Polyangiaceae bacterium]